MSGRPGLGAIEVCDAGLCRGMHSTAYSGVLGEICAGPVAAALTCAAGQGKVWCILSGGDIASDKLVRILEGQVP